MRILRHVLLAVLYGIAGVLIVGVVFYVDYLESRPDLQPWHLAELDAEFTADETREVTSLADYLALEDRLFAQLRKEVYAQTTTADARLLNRYHAGSLADPLAEGRDWNRSFELTHDSPRGAVLLLHGLSDSPYSMRALARLFHARGYHVLALRLPGHGTAPSGLAHVHWDDFAAATRLAARDLRARLPAPLPFYIAGYSTGAALAVEYSLAILEGEKLPTADGLILVSPAIGVPGVAALAKWQARLGDLLGLDKLAWQSIQPAPRHGAGCCRDAAAARISVGGGCHGIERGAGTGVDAPARVRRTRTGAVRYQSSRRSGGVAGARSGRAPASAVVRCLAALCA
jgi:poly(3-hydroxybutyrate) depolymerase